MLDSPRRWQGRTAGRDSQPRCGSPAEGGLHSALQARRYRRQCRGDAQHRLQDQDCRTSHRQGTDHGLRPDSHRREGRQARAQRRRTHRHSQGQGEGSQQEGCSSARPGQQLRGRVRPRHQLHQPLRGRWRVYARRGRYAEAQLLACSDRQRYGCQPAASLRGLAQPRHQPQVYRGREGQEFSFG